MESQQGKMKRFPGRAKSYVLNVKVTFVYYLSSDLQQYFLQIPYLQSENEALLIGCCGNERCTCLLFRLFLQNELNPNVHVEPLTTIHLLHTDTEHTTCCMSTDYGFKNGGYHVSGASGPDCRG